MKEESQRVNRFWFYSRELQTAQFLTRKQKRKHKSTVSSFILIDWFIKEMKLLMLHLPFFLPLSYTFQFVGQLQFEWWYEFGQKGEGKAAQISCVMRLQGIQEDKHYEWPNCRKSCSHSFYVFRCQSQSILRCSTTGKQVSLDLLLTEGLLRRRQVSFRLELKVTPFSGSGLYTGVWKSIRGKNCAWNCSSS